MEKMVILPLLPRIPTSEFWTNKRVLVTGHTGFKGGWLCLWLQSLGAELCGLSLEPSTSPSLFELTELKQTMRSVIGDIRNPLTVNQVVSEFQPDVIFHLAAQPLVLESYRHPLLTYETNIMGTINLLEALRTSSSTQVFVNVTSDKCYQDKNDGKAYIENDSMGGNDPYSSSKACSEIITAAYRNSFINKAGIGLATARAGNVIGGGDWAQDRLVPDVLKAFELHRPVVVRNPNAIRPWQHVVEPICGYILLAQSLWRDPISYSAGWNFGPNEESVRTVSWIVDNLKRTWGGDASWILDADSQSPHESISLKLDPTKTRQELGWQVRLDLEEALEKTVLWHRGWINGENCRKQTLQQINEYIGKIER